MPQKTTLISEELKELIETAATSFTNFGSTWAKIKEIGLPEGHTEDELKNMVMSQIKNALPDKTDKKKVQQVKKKVWYFFHSDEQKARAKRNRDKNTGGGGTNVIQNDDKKGTEETSTDTKPTDSYYEKTIKNLEDTIAELRAEIAELKEPDEYVQNMEAELEELKQARAKDLALLPGEKKLGPLIPGKRIFAGLKECIEKVDNGKWSGFWILVDGSKITAFAALEK